jgi:hypothetical protein
MTCFNFIGLALGPLLAGPLIEYAPHPLRLPFAVYLAIVGLTGLLVATQCETMFKRARPSFAPRLGLPRGARAAFIAPAASGFAAMAVVGFYAALGPSTIRRDIGIANSAVISLIIAELFIVAAGIIVASQGWPPRRAMLTGLAATPLGMALLITAQRTASLPALLAGTAVCGVVGALGYRGGLAVANGLAPPERRAEVASAFFICCFCGNAVPIIGVGALTHVRGSRFADLIFAIVVTAIALGAAIAALAAPSRPTDRAAG